MTIQEILDGQRQYFSSGKTRDIEFRKEQLVKLKKAIKANEESIYSALKADLNKSRIEAYMCEVGLVLKEIDFCLKHLKAWARPKRVSAGLATFPSKAYVQCVPKGNVLIMSPWNYPFLLTLEPLVDAISAGNTAVVKPSAYSAATSELIANMLGQTFEAELVAVVTGGREENQDLLSQKFDHIFFTGSKAVGHEVLKRAEANLTPVTLELGGKSPCIVHSSADVCLAARRIVFGKLLNAGQTCIAPDYVLVQREVKDDLVKALIAEIERQYGKDQLANPNYGKMISQKHFDGALALLAGQKILYGGGSDPAQLKVQPTIVDEPSLEDSIMTTEIFAPILPIIAFDTLEDALKVIAKNPTPLAMYVFALDRAVVSHFLNNVQCGGVCINDTIMHIASQKLPFGGVGQSGMGCYHGKFGFETFSHKRTLLKRSNHLDLSVRYQPMDEKKAKIIKKLM